MYAIYGVTFTINLPQMLVYIPYMDPMGMKLRTWKLYKLYIYINHINHPNHWGFSEMENPPFGMMTEVYPTSGSDHGPWLFFRISQPQIT